MTGIPFDREALLRELAAAPFRQRSGDGGQRPHWSVIAADERQERMYGELPELRDETRSLGDWQDDLVDTGQVDEDRTLTDELPAGYDPRVWRQAL